MLKLYAGQSKKDRITFITTENRSMTAIRKENGEIEVQSGKNEEVKGSVTTILLIFVVVLVIKAWILLPLIEKGKLGIGWYLIPTFLYSFFAVLTIIVVRKDLGKEGLRNHGAEHMVLAAYQKLKRIPTIEEAARFSRICRVCGITIFSSFIIAQLIGFAVYVYYGYRISEIIIFLVSLFLYGRFPFNLIGKVAQFFTTSKPKEQNLELAIRALSELEKREMLREMVAKYVHDALTK